MLAFTQVTVQILSDSSNIRCISENTSDFLNPLCAAALDYAFSIYIILDIWLNAKPNFSNTTLMKIRDSLIC